MFTNKLFISFPQILTYAGRAFRLRPGMIGIIPLPPSVRRARPVWIGPNAILRGPGVGGFVGGFVDPESAAEAGAGAEATPEATPEAGAEATLEAGAGAEATGVGSFM